MKRKIFIIAVIVIGLAAFLGSCKKKTVEPTSDAEPTSAEDIPICTHDSLFYVAAKQPTGEENGCVGHYECACCGATFADAQGTTPVDNTILWATNYVFDMDNIIENDFAEWVGDEPYLLRACHGNLDGLGDEGSLYDDYTGWEDWTEAEWQAYWNCINDYYIECGGEGGIDTSPTSNAECIYSIFLERSVNKKKLSNIDQQLKPFFKKKENQGQDYSPFGELNKRLDTVMMKIGSIQSSINKLTDMVAVNRYRDMMNHRYEKMVGLLNATYDYFNPILRMIAAENPSGFNSLSDSTKYKIRMLTEFWHKTPVGGTLPELQMMNMLQFMKGDFITGSTVPQIYDSIASHTGPWWHQARTYREMTRTVDVVVMAECYVMNLLYYKTHPEETYVDRATNDTTFLHQNTINLLMLGYVDALKTSNINYNEDYLICQIPGAKAKVKKKLKLLDPYEYIKNNKKCLMNDNNIDQFRKWLLPTGSVSKEWYRIVYQYYEKIAKSKQETIGNEFLYDKLRKIGFIDIPTKFNDFIVGDCDCDLHKLEGSYDQWYRLFYYQIEPWTYHHDFFGFHTCVNKTNGCNHTADAVLTMTIRETSHEIIDIGQKITYRDFYAIELY